MLDHCLRRTNIKPALVQYIVFHCGPSTLASQQTRDVHQCCFNVGPPSATLSQRLVFTGILALSICWHHQMILIQFRSLGITQRERATQIFLFTISCCHVLVTRNLKIVLPYKKNYGACKKDTITFDIFNSFYNYDIYISYDILIHQ